MQCKRVFVVGVDGVRGAAIGEADTPNIDKVMEEGAWTLKAQTVMPSSSYQAWGSMFEEWGYPHSMPTTPT